MAERGRPAAGGEHAAPVPAGVAREGALSPADLLLWPVSLPLKGLLFVLAVVADMAERELADESHLRQQLLELQLRYEEGEIDEAAYRILWRDIAERMARLQEGGGTV